LCTCKLRSLGIAMLDSRKKDVLPDVTFELGNVPVADALRVLKNFGRLLTEQPQTRPWMPCFTSFHLVKGKDLQVFKAAVLFSWITGDSTPICDLFLQDYPKILDGTILEKPIAKSLADKKPVSIPDKLSPIQSAPAGTTVPQLSLDYVVRKIDSESETSPENFISMGAFKENSRKAYMNDLDAEMQRFEDMRNVESYTEAEFDQFIERYKIMNNVEED